MDLTEGILRRAARVSHMLAFLAALFLAVNPHPLHAQSDEGAGHSHFGSFCEALDGGKSLPDGKGGPQGFHGDCIHHFDPMVQAPIEQYTAYVSLAAMPLYEAPTRQISLTSDPPPPRSPS